jgi:RNA polymerase-binding transcription factor DksA
MTNSVVRYSDAELAEFQALIEQKLEKSREQLNSLQEQILEITENSSDEHGGDWVDDSSMNNDVEMLNNMAIRQRMYIQDLENALVRIRNKTYGICAITGELIDKRRLLAVPTTTKSLAAKTELQAQQQPQSPQVAAEDKAAAPRLQRPVAPKPPANPKVITKIIRKPTTSTKPKPSSFDEDEDDMFENELFYDDEDDPIRRAVNDLDEVPEGIETPTDETDVDVDLDIELDMDMDIEDMDIDLDKDIDGIDDEEGGEEDKEYDY